METTAQSQQSTSQSQTRNILFWVLALVMLCLSALLLLGFLLLPAPRQSQAEALDQEFHNNEYGIRLSLPASWVYMDAATGHNTFVMQFASSEQALDEMPSSPEKGAGILVYSGSATVEEDFPGTTDIVEINRRVAAQQFAVYDVLEEPYPLDLPDYQASSALYLFSLLKEKNVFLSTDGRNLISYLTVVRRDKELIRFIAVCPPDEWLDYRPTIEAIMRSVEVSARQY